MTTTDLRSAVPAVALLARERGIPVDALWQGIADGLHEAYLRSPGAVRDTHVEIDTETFDLAVKCVDGTDVTPAGFGRISANVFKRELHATVQRVQRALALQAFAGKELTIVEGTVTHVTDRRATVRIRDLEAVLPRSEQIPGERLRRDQVICALLVELRPEGDDALMLSRTHPEFVPLLLAHLVPAIADGKVTITDIARIPGQRTKVAVYSPFGAREALRNIIGVGGSTIRAVQRALGVERLDVVPFDEDPVVFAAAALGVEVSEVVIEEDDVIVKPTQTERSRVIGVGGGNVTAAEQLLGRRVVLGGEIH